MKHCSLFCAGWWPFLLLPLLLLMPLLFFNWDRIERDVAAKARSIVTTEHQWAEVETYNRGRDVLLSGTAPNQQAIDQVVDLVSNANGVRTVTYVGKIAQTPIASVIDVSFENDDVIVKGIVDSNTTAESVLASAAASFGKGRVINQLSIADNATTAPAISGLFSALRTLGDGIQVSIQNNQLSISGEVDSEASKNTIGTQLTKLFNGRVENLLNVKVEIVEHDICEELIGELLTTANINFQSSEATIKSGSHTLLDQIADTAKRCPEAHFEVAGHTDSTGNEEINSALSQRRAQAVIDHLESLNLDTQNFSAKGYGSNQPVGSNGTSAGRAANRRIEFKLRN